VFPHSPQGAGLFVSFAHPFAQRADQKANLAHDEEKSGRIAIRLSYCPRTMQASLPSSKISLRAMLWL
jgi:hypothetical protein